LKNGNHGNSQDHSHPGHAAGAGGEGKDRNLHNPIEDRLIPLEPLDLAKITSIDGLVRAMAKTAFTGRQLGEAADVLEAMALDEDAFIVMTLAGAMTVAKQGLIVTELIDRGIVNAIVSTGALMAHGLVEATGRAHFRANPEVSDEELYEQGYNRVYDTLEPEQNLDDVEEVMAAVLEAWDHNEIMCSYKLNHAIGAFLAKRDKGQRGILKSAYEMGVPVFVPAFSDSELGLDTALNNRLRESTGRHKIRGDPAAPEKAGNIHHRRRRSAELVPAIRSVHRTAAPTAGRERSVEALPLWPEDLPRASSLGRTVRESLQRSDFVGQVRTSVGRWEVWRSLCGRNRRAADHRCGGSGTSRQEPQDLEKREEAGGETEISLAGPG
jgi:hypothetical protein